AGESGSVIDFIRRAQAVQTFADDPDVESLIAANKRAANLLELANLEEMGEIDESSLEIDAEKRLFDEVRRTESALVEQIEQQDYPAALSLLAALRPAVDQFFNDVMVMVDDPDLRGNRLALLARLRKLFLRVADVAKLGRA
ncbi:MAG: glycine--tRNA ligase subunit beta, partial [Xanthomonadaceae bacterium]|nr:glycine--tRNA ligase subunit beta [Xanthomonadaceae bacterium]